MAGDPRWELAWFDYYFAQFPFADASFDLSRLKAAYGADYDSNDALGRFYLAMGLACAKLLWFPPEQPRTQWAVGTLKGVLKEFGDQ